jgi:hypothetical protein
MAELLSKTEIVSAVQAALEKKDFNEESWKLIQRSTKKVLERCQQDFQGAAQDTARMASSKLSQGLKDSLLALSSEFYEEVAEFDGAILPNNCRYVRRQKGSVSLLIEQPPTVRTLNIQGERYRLALPYALFAINFQGTQFASMHCGWRKKPMRSLEDKYGPICLPNMQSGQHPCWGSTDFNLEGKTVAEQADEIVAKYWMSSFNGDLTEYYKHFLSSNNLGGAADWQKKTAKDSLWILEAEFSTAGYKLADHLILSADKKQRRDHFINNVDKQITDTVVEISQRVVGMIARMDFDDNNRPKFSQEELSGVIKEIILQAYTELCEYNDAVLARERLRLEEELAMILRDYELRKQRKDTW